MANITVANIPDFDCSYRKEYIINYTITLNNGEEINDVTVTSSQLWCNVKNNSVTNYSVEIEIGANYSIENRESIIYIEVDTNQGVFTNTVTVIQEKLKIYPIWADNIVRIETAVNYVSYYIKHQNNIIYAGKAYVMPNNNYVEIDVSKICSSYIDSSMETAFNAPQDYNKQNGVGLFGLYVNDELHSHYIYMNSYTYKDNPPYIYHREDYYISLSEPIRAIYDSRQYIIYSFFNATHNEVDYISSFYFYLNGGSQVGILNSNCESRTEYTLLTKAPTGSNSIELLGELREIKDTCCKYCLYYQNALGGWDSFLINGNDKQTDNITSYNYVKAVNNTTKDFGNKKYLNLISQTYQLYTDWLTDNEASKMHHLLESTEVYLHNLEDDSIIPVNITNTICEYKTFSNNGKKKFYYEIDVELAQYRIRQ